MIRRILGRGAVGICAVGALVGVTIAAFTVGEYEADQRAYSEQTGYDLPEFNSCNLVHVDDAWIVTGSSHVASSSALELYPANLSCTNGQIEAYNASAQQHGSRVRVCRDDYTPLGLVSLGGEPQSCTTVGEAK